MSPTLRDDALPVPVSGLCAKKGTFRLNNTIYAVEHPNNAELSGNMFPATLPVMVNSTIWCTYSYGDSFP